MQPRVLAVDDEPEFLALEQSYLKKHDIEVTACVSPLEAIEDVKCGDFDIVVSDYMMPELSGVDLLKTLRREGCGIGFILFTGKGREEVAIEALNAGADYYLQKDANMSSQFALLARAIDEIYEAKRSEQALVDSENLLRISNKRLDLLGSITRHDIRSEITIADGYLGLIDEEMDAERVREHLLKAKNAIRKIAGILEIARTYQINGAMNIKWSSLHTALDNAISTVDMPGVTYTNSSEDWTILVDPLLEMVCANIFSNSVKHGIHVTEIRVSSQERSDGLDLIIEDNGVGIAPEQKEKIFGFMTPEGVPHGLSIARRILDAEQIKISETGSEGEGARFVLHFPAGLYKERRRA